MERLVQRWRQLSKRQQVVSLVIGGLAGLIRILAKNE
jgi:hypothetical protein